MAARKGKGLSLDAPAENFSRGLLGIEIPELGPKIPGTKVRDIWIVGDKRAMVSTDRQSAFDRMICTIPGKGQVLNLLSAYWFERTRKIVPNHLIAVPHPNIMIARQAQDTLPVELVLRRYMARSSTPTSVYYNYTELGRREIYGVGFPEGLRPNQEFPMGTIITPTTKAKTGHDQELTDEEAQKIVDAKFGQGMWTETRRAALALFEDGRTYLKKRGLILVDTKYEFGIDSKGKLVLIDEVHTPDSSRFWLLKTYPEKFESGENPDTFDKEILRRWLASQGFRGEGMVPVVDPKVIDQMAGAYRMPYDMVTGKKLPETVAEATQIRKAILQYFNQV